MEFCNKNSIEQFIVANEEENNLKVSSIKDFKENIAVLIGPEGGFSAKEKEKLALNSKVISVTLGNRVLRTEIATICMLACINLIRG